MGTSCSSHASNCDCKKCRTKRELALTKTWTQVNYCALAHKEAVVAFLENHTVEELQFFRQLHGIGKPVAYPPDWKFTQEELAVYRSFVFSVHKIDPTTITDESLLNFVVAAATASARNANETATGDL